MADPVTATVTCSIPNPLGGDPITRSETFDFDPDKNFDEPIDIEYKNESSGGPVFLPKNMPSGL